MKENVLSSQNKGKIAEIRVELRALEKGLTISRPTTDARYDCILDNGISLTRVQIKYCTREDRRYKASYLIDLRKPHKNHNLLYSKEEIDAIIAFIPAENKLIYLPSSVFKDRQILFVKKIKIERSKYDLFLEDLVW